MDELIEIIENVGEEIIENIEEENIEEENIEEENIEEEIIENVEEENIGEEIIVDKKIPNEILKINKVILKDGRKVTFSMKNGMVVGKVHISDKKNGRIIVDYKDDNILGQYQKFDKYGDLISDIIITAEGLVPRIIETSVGCWSTIKRMRNQ